MYKQAILSRLMHFPPNFQVLCSIIHGEWTTMDIEARRPQLDTNMRNLNPAC